MARVGRFGFQERSTSPIPLRHWGAGALTGFRVISEGMLRGLRHHRTGFARTLAAFALLAMVVRALVPAGYMFAPTQDHRFITVTLCSGHGPAEAVIDLTTGAIVDPGSTNQSDEPSKKSPNADAPCVFAVAAALSAPEQPASLPVVFRLASADLPRAIEVAPGRGLAAPPPWSTGPPLTV